MGKKRNGSEIKCSACEKLFYVPEYRIKTAKFCSLKCQNHTQYEKFKFNCFNCNKLCETSPCRKGLRKFCSRECRASFEIDKISCQKEKRREQISKARAKGIVGNSGPALRKWVLQNKENKCEICGFNEYLSCMDIHHADRNPNNNTLENLKILCVMCHRKVHRNIISLIGS